MGKKRQSEEEKERKKHIDDIINQTFNDKQLDALEHTMNQLLKNTRDLRFACYNVVKKKIELRMRQRRDATIKALQKAVKVTPGVSLSDSDKEKIIEILRENTDLSQDAAERVAREYIINLFSPTVNSLKNAFDAVMETMLDQEITAFSKELDDKKILSKSGWCKFANAINYTGSETLDAIADELGMSAEEKEKLQTLNIPESVNINESITGETERLIKPFLPDKPTYANINNFCEECGLSIDSLRKFNLSMLKRKPKDTSDEVKFFILLKLIAAFRLEEEEAREYLAKVDRSFIMSVDLAFLTAITTGYKIKPKRPQYVALITHFLSGRIDETTYYTDCPRFASPYRFDYLDEYALDAGIAASPHRLRNNTNK